MYLHIGNNRTVKERDIIGIFDPDTCTVSAVTKNFLKKAEAERKLEGAGGEIPKAFVVESGGGSEKVYFSQLSVKALIGRSALK